MKRRTGGKPAIGALFLVVLIPGVAANCWWRGPLFGLLPFLVFTLPPALIVGMLLRHSGLPHKASLALAAAASLLISYVFCAPPRTSHVFERFLKTEQPEDIRELRRWNDNWGRDPAYYLRFSASSDTVERLARAGQLNERADPGPRVPPRPLWRSVPEWWKPDEIRSPRRWDRIFDGSFGIELCYDPKSEVAYLSVLTL